MYDTPKERHNFARSDLNCLSALGSSQYCSWLLFIIRILLINQPSLRILNHGEVSPSALHAEGFHGQRNIFALLI